ncbi:10090_t:CDS:2, partial [Ambispora gerdemannii]
TAEKLHNFGHYPLTPSKYSQFGLEIDDHTSKLQEQLSESSDSSCEDYCVDSENLASYHEKLSISKNTPEIIVDGLLNLLDKQLNYEKNVLTIGRSLESYYQQNTPDSFDVYAFCTFLHNSKDKTQYWTLLGFFYYTGCIINKNSELAAKIFE